MAGLLKVGDVDPRLGCDPENGAIANLFAKARHGLWSIRHFGIGAGQADAHEHGSDKRRDLAEPFAPPAIAGVTADARGLIENRP